jgi:hypothetical protein
MSDERIVAAELAKLGWGGQKIRETGKKVHEVADSLPPSTAFAAVGVEHDDYTSEVVGYYDQVRELGLEVLEALSKLLAGHGNDVRDVAGIFSVAVDAATDAANSDPPPGGRR